MSEILTLIINGDECLQRWLCSLLHLTGAVPKQAATQLGCFFAVAIPPIRYASSSDSRFAIATGNGGYSQYFP
jgi:hypothetical protein